MAFWIVAHEVVQLFPEPFGAVLHVGDIVRDDGSADLDELAGVEVLVHVLVVRVRDAHARDARGVLGHADGPAAEFVPVYREDVESRRTGEVLDVRDFFNSLSANRP